MTKEIALYVATTFKHGNDGRKVIEDIRIPTKSCLMTYQLLLQQQQRKSGEKVDECTKTR